MRAIARCLAWLRRLDEISARPSPLHCLHPSAILLVAGCYLLTVMSFGRHEIAGLLPLLLYPSLIIAFSGVPLAVVAAPLLLAEPFIIGIGILHPILDTRPTPVAGMLLSAGWLALASLAIKCSLAVSGAILLAATLGMERLALGLRRLGLPGGLTLQLILTYRFLWVLLEEAGHILLAYALRSRDGGGVRHRDWGPVAGGLLLRTYGRAERIYQSMLLRGFDGEFRAGGGRAVRAADILYVTGWLAFFALVRFHRLPEYLAALVTIGNL